MIRLRIARMLFASSARIPNSEPLKMYLQTRMPIMPVDSELLYSVPNSPKRIYTRSIAENIPRCARPEECQECVRCLPYNGLEELDFDATALRRLEDRRPS